MNKLEHVSGMLLQDVPICSVATVIGTLCNARTIVETAYPELSIADILRQPAAGFDEEPVHGLASDAQRLMRHKHGSGYPRYAFDASHSEVVRNNTRQLGYNNEGHAIAFDQAMTLMGRMLRRPAWERVAHKPIAGAHDIVQTNIIAVPPRPRRGEDERDSAEWLVNKVKERNIACVVSLIGAYGIEGTQLRVDSNNVIIGQHARLQPDNYYPGGREGALWYSAKMSGTADTATLYMPTSFLHSHMLFLQRLGLTPYDTPNQGQFEEFATHVESQVTFLAMHEFALDEGEELFGRLRPAVVDETKMLLDLLRSKKITSWKQVHAHARSFAVKNKKYELFMDQNSL